jgi:hypothetical protein
MEKPQPKGLTNRVTSMLDNTPPGIPIPNFDESALWKTEKSPGSEQADPPQNKSTPILKTMTRLLIIYLSFINETFSNFTSHPVLRPIVERAAYGHALSLCERPTGEMLIRLMLCAYPVPQGNGVTGMSLAETKISCCLAKLGRAMQSPACHGKQRFPKIHPKTLPANSVNLVKTPDQHGENT